MEIEVPTGIVEEFPCARTGKILGSNAFKDILSLSKRIPGSIGMAPGTLSSSLVPIIVNEILQSPSLWCNRVESKRGEMCLIVDVPDDDKEYYTSRRWRGRFVVRAKGKESYRIDNVSDVPVFWIEELKEGEMP